MRETEFRRLLSGRLGERSIDSYVAYCRRVERDLGVDLDACDLSEAGLAAMGSRLRAAGVRDKSLSNCMSGLRAYADLAGTASTARAKAGRMTITPAQRESWAANTASGPFNQWLDAQVKDDDGRMDLDRLHALAGQFGVDRRREYEHLNPGQQRMNLGNILRRLVPEALYAAQEAPPAPVEVSPDRPTETSTQHQPRLSSIHQATVGELLAIYGEIMDELRGRGVVRTGNSPVGDYAELLFATAFGWELERNSASGHDATDAQGMRYQIKGRRLSSLAASRQLSAIRRLPEHNFDYLAAVLFDSAFKVTRAIVVPHEVVAAGARRVEHTNSWTFILDDRVWRERGVRDVTAEIAVAASRL